jgi:hypothetical protein
MARDYSDPAYLAAHNLVVDCYCLQHPSQFCRSGKSFAAHLGRLCVAMSDCPRALDLLADLRAWLDGPNQPDKPDLPGDRGLLTLGDVGFDLDPGRWQVEVERWAAEVWRAHAPLQPLARKWLEDAERGRLTR